MMTKREIASFNLMWLRLDGGMTRKKLASLMPYEYNTIWRNEFAMQSPTFEYLQDFAYIIGRPTRMLADMLENKQHAEEAQGIRLACKCMASSTNACKQQRKYILDAIYRNGYKSVTAFCRENHIAIKTPRSFSGRRNDGGISAVRDVELYKYAKLLNMQFDWGEKLWR